MNDMESLAYKQPETARSNVQKPEASAKGPVSSEDQHLEEHPEFQMTEEALRREQRRLQKQKIREHRRAVARRKRFHDVLLGLVFLIVMVVVLVVNLTAKDRTYSEMENRNLAQWPEFSWSSLKDGSFFSGLEDYVSDQFFLRDRWMSLELKLETMMGKTESSGVYLGKDDYLLSNPETPDTEAVSRSVAAIEAFAQGHPEFSTRVMLVPGAAAVLGDKLPQNAPVRNQLKDIEAVKTELVVGSPIQFLDAGAPLAAHADEYIYYKTDHHWTSLGASYAFQACAGQMGLTNADGMYEIYTVTDSFEGTLASKSGSHKTKDSIQVYGPVGTDVSYYVTYPDSPEKVCSLFKSECLDTKDKYTVFFGGNYSKVEIATTAGNNRCLLVFKDSYANSFIQFLTPYFEKIIMIDPRYFYDDPEPILTSEGVTDVLFLYSADTFFKDTSLADVLEAADGETEEAPFGAEPVPEPEPSATPESSSEEAPETFGGGF